MFYIFNSFLSLNQDIIYSSPPLVRSKIVAHFKRDKKSNIYSAFNINNSREENSLHAVILSFTFLSSCTLDSVMKCR